MLAHSTLKICQFGQKPEWPASSQYSPLLAQCLRDDHLAFQVVTCTTGCRVVYFTSIPILLTVKEIRTLLV